MADTDQKAPATLAAVAPDPVTFDVTLEEFCLRKSGQVHAPEMIGAFHHEEKRLGHVKDAEAAFEARYLAFATRPV